ncbi:unnamed protein product [Heligmosomoides polygyrus]|uniref:S ribonuclease n=1 Tax=Heligmosomoides polygyrus TaxID=6339 RepID=A0A183FBC2_HELPZ|nr:unnamed protein product [Heligmosomoides polygyrus]
MSGDARVVIHLLTLKCGQPLDKEPSREEIKLAERTASILKDFETGQLEVDENEQLEMVEEQEEDWDPKDELIDVGVKSFHPKTLSYVHCLLASPPFCRSKGSSVHDFPFDLQKRDNILKGSVETADSFGWLKEKGFVIVTSKVVSLVYL